MNNRASFYKAKGITFIPTYRCPAKCSHCNVKDNGAGMGGMDIDFALDILHQARSMGITAFQFSGGEPTLYPDFIIAVIREGQKLSMRCHRPPTSGYIGRFPDKARDFMGRLKDVGYQSGFRLSLDFYHDYYAQDWADFTLFFGEFFSFRQFSIGCCGKERGRTERRLERYADNLRDRGLEVTLRLSMGRMYLNGEKVKVGFWAPTRPTYKELNDSEFNFRKINSRKGCLGPEGVGYLWVEPSGHLRICAGNANVAIPDLVIGNLKKERLDGLMKKVYRKKAYRILAQDGPLGLVESIKKAEPELFPADSLYTHRCELCYRIFTMKRSREILTSLKIL